MLKKAQKKIEIFSFSSIFSFFFFTSRFCCCDCQGDLLTMCWKGKKTTTKNAASETNFLSNFFPNQSFWNRPILILIFINY